MPRKRKTATRRRTAPTRTVAVAAPRRKRRIRRTVKRVARRTGRAVRRGASAVGRVAADEKHTLFAAGAGAVLGALHNRVDLSKIPLSSTLTVPGVLGIGLFVGSKIIKTGTAGQILRHGATGMLSIAAYELAKEHLAGEVAKPKTAGWDDFYGDEDTIFEDDI